MTWHVVLLVLMPCCIFCRHCCIYVFAFFLFICSQLGCVYTLFCVWTCRGIVWASLHLCSSWYGPFVSETDPQVWGMRSAGKFCTCLGISCFSCGDCAHMYSHLCFHFPHRMWITPTCSCSVAVLALSSFVLLCIRCIRTSAHLGVFVVLLYFVVHVVHYILLYVDLLYACCIQVYIVIGPFPHMQGEEVLLYIVLLEMMMFYFQL